jgi:elongation factor G
MCCAFLLAARRGRIEGTQQTRPGWTAITALVPETELGSYVGDLRGLTQGQGIATMVHDHLAPLPEHVRPVGAEQLVDATS